MRDPDHMLLAANTDPGLEQGATYVYNWRDQFFLEVRSTHYITLHYSIVQCSTVQYSTVQYSTVQYSTVQYFLEAQSGYDIRGSVWGGSVRVLSIFTPALLLSSRRD